ncbi:MAG: aminopeptidase P family protein, partial [Candidatus Neomarinimicrobiota bacterium]
RRKVLAGTLGKGLVLLPGNFDSPLNYGANIYPFRQDSTFLYYLGLKQPGLAAVINTETGKTLLFGKEASIEDTIWSGYQLTLGEMAVKSGIDGVKSLTNLPESLNLKSGQKLHFLPQYRAKNLQQLSELLNLTPADVEKNSSRKLIEAVVSQRAIKSSLEIKEIESALEVTSGMHLKAMKITEAGLAEREIAGIIEGFALALGRRQAYPIIFTKHGEILHNKSYHNILMTGDLVLMDAGAESSQGYASDITRTFPVNGKFSLKQREIYELVLEMQEKAIGLCSPGIPFLDIHLAAARIAVSGLKELGLMRGDADEAVARGAHALFFPHGLGHMLGLDVHDMENFGEDHIGYNDSFKRNRQFGLNNLRLAKPLEEGNVITVEPGLYFIPSLIKIWKQKHKLAEFINYSKLEKYLDFGGIRIEDNITILNQGCRVLGKPIPKTVDAVEEAS